MQDKEKKAEVTILICLIICDLTGIFYYGLRALYVCVLSAFLCFVTNAVCCKIRKIKITESLAAVICGLEIASLMSSTVSFYVLILADLFGIIVVRAAFGGKDNEIFSPAATAYLFAEITFPAILSYPKVFSYSSEITSSTVQKAANYVTSDFELLIGRYSSPIGTGAVILLVIIGIILFAQRISDVTVFLTATAVYGLFSALFYSVSDMKYNLAAEMYLFCMIFFVSAKAPKKFLNKVIYGIFVGLMLILFETLSDAQNPIIYAAVLSAPVKIILCDKENAKIQSGGARFASQQGK